MVNDSVTNDNPDPDSEKNGTDAGPQSNKRPNLSFLVDHFEQALQSFYGTVDQIIADNPVDTALLASQMKEAAANSLDDTGKSQLAVLKLAALKQGLAVGAVVGFFLKYKPYPMLEEIRNRGAVFQPLFGPVLVADNSLVRDVLSRHDEFTVDPYGAEMRKTMSYKYNGGFDTFILSTDDDSKFVEDKKLLTTVVTKDDALTIAGAIHNESIHRVAAAVHRARKTGTMQIDVVTDLARYVPVYLGHMYLGVPVAEQRGAFELSDAMLKYYGDKAPGPDGKTPLPESYTRADGKTVELPDSALGREDGVIPDEKTVYWWIVSAFRNFFNNVEKDIEVQAHGVRACRELLAYLLREIEIQRQILENDPGRVADTMLTRLLKMQMGLAPLQGIDPSRVSDLRIAENVMGTIVGAIAGQEEATCRVIDSMIRLKEGDFRPQSEFTAQNGRRLGSFEEARRLALDIINGKDVNENRKELIKYVYEALRLQPQGEVLLRQCIKEGSTIGNSRPLAAGSLVFAAHGSAMQDVDQPGSFILGRDAEAYLHYGYQRHKCLGQYVSPVIICEALVAILCLENIRRPQPEPGQTNFPFERRFGHFQLDDNNLYARSFVLEFDDGGDTTIHYPMEDQ